VANKDTRFYVCVMDWKPCCTDQSIQVDNAAKFMIEKELDSYLYKVLIDSLTIQPSLSNQICDLLSSSTSTRYQVESKI
jgi:hypothetical protein